MSERETDTTGLPQEIIDRLRAARSVAVLTGAGISKESGIPTFREPGGLWSQFDPRKHASLRGWEEDPRLMWGWYGVRRGAMRSAQPNAAHLALRRLEEYYPDFTCITQNIDNLHQLAGNDHVLELHGNIHRFRCSAEGTLLADVPGVNDPVDAAALARGEGPEVPRCPDCGAMVRPDVVWFGEALDEATFDRASQAARRAEVFFLIGTSSIVEPAASLPVEALHYGAMLVEINPEPTPLSEWAALALRGPAGTILPLLVTLITGTEDRATPPVPDADSGQR